MCVYAYTYVHTSIDEDNKSTDSLVHGSNSSERFGSARSCGASTEVYLPGMRKCIRQACRRRTSQVVHSQASSKSISELNFQALWTASAKGMRLGSCRAAVSLLQQSCTSIYATCSMNRTNLSSKPKTLKTQNPDPEFNTK